MNKIIQYGHLSKNSSDEDYFNHIFSHTLGTEMCDSSKPIYELTFEYDVDQTRDKDTKKLEYWGWYDNKRKDMSMIFAAYFLFDMCFPSGAKVAEEAGQGKGIKLNLIKAEIVEK